MVRATLGTTVVAESDETVVIEGNHYFPPESVRWEHLVETPSTSWCFWKGKARYYAVQVEDDAAPNAAWTYRRPWRLARRIKDHVAFWGRVEVTE